MDAIDEALQKHDLSAYVAYGSSADADIRYLTRFRVPDPVVYVKKRGEEGVIFVSTMEYERARREASCRVMSLNEVGFYEYLKEHPDDRRRATAQVIAKAAGGPVAVPPQFPLALARELEQFCPVTVEAEAVPSLRAVKEPWELDAIRGVQRVTERAMGVAIDLIRRSRPRGEQLILDDEVLTSERVKIAIDTFLIRQGCVARETIVSSGRDTAIPHRTGSGPLAPDQPIIIDLYPWEESSGYYADMTRTVVKGEPADDIRDMYEAVREAQNRAAGFLRAGISGAEVHQSTVEFFQEKGYESNTQGFIHNLGHGVGLEVHERPVLGQGGKILQAGNVVTVEPGLYYLETGGVRLEDMGAIQENGFDRFTSFEERLAI